MIRIAALNASSTVEDDHEGSFKSHKTQTKEAQEAEAFALYHKALDLQKHDRFEESAKAYQKLLEARLLRELTCPPPVARHLPMGFHLCSLCKPQQSEERTLET
ncbi:calcineurin-binding protein cabin-1 isoform X2 [Callithrix jacchus]|uniref:calcineurin-binding protein cabin-1 isoform X2 n=1 Tax=Callithrix jacchus TaxID=9483 RepID=UPI00159D0C3A|nr:calcineurin-binding protein cabin-1 isoform X2 [Callithrix jacchus]